MAKFINQTLDNRLLAEEGIIIRKEYKKATEAGEFEGKKYDAKPERFSVMTMSAPLIDENLGCVTFNALGAKVPTNPVVLEFELPIEKKKEYDAMKFGDKVTVRYVYKSFNGQSIYTPIDFKKQV